MFVISYINATAEPATVNVAFPVLNFPLVDPLHNFIMRKGFFGKHFDDSFSLSTESSGILVHDLLFFCGNLTPHKWKLCGDSENKSFESSFPSVVKFFAYIPDYDNDG